MPGSTTLTFTFEGKPLLSTCSDTYVVATIDDVAMVTLSTAGTKGTHTLRWNATSAVGGEPSTGAAAPRYGGLRHSGAVFARAAASHPRPCPRPTTSP